MGGTVSESDWKAELQGWVEEWVGGWPGTRDRALTALMPHIDAAYKRGLMAGRSQAGYAATRRKPREGDS